MYSPAYVRFMHTCRLAQNRFLIQKMAMNVIVLITFLTCTSMYYGSARVEMPNENAQIVGKTFYLPHINLLETITGGQSIFNSTQLQNCIVQTSIQDDHNVLEWYKDNEVLYRAVADEAGLSGSYKGSFTLKTSLDSVYSTESWKVTESEKLFS